MKEKQTVIVVRRARPTGGKAGKGYNKTSTWQVCSLWPDGGSEILKIFRFRVNDPADENKALASARKFGSEQENKK